MVSAGVGVILTLARPPGATAQTAPDPPTAPPLAAGVEARTRGAAGADVTVRLERLATRDWTLGPLAIRPFARLVVDGASITVRRSADADLAAAATPAGDAPAGAGEPVVTLLHRLVEGLAGRELVEFTIRDLSFSVLRNGERGLALEARVARVDPDRAGLELRDVRGDTEAGQRLEAKRVRLRWDPERIDLRGPWRLCEADACARHEERAELAFEPATGRLLPAPARPGRPAPPRGRGAASPAGAP